MPKTKLAKFKESKKPKLTKEERSAVAKARWAKRRANDAMEEVVVTINTMLEQGASKESPTVPQPPAEQPPAVPESVTNTPDPVMQAAGMRIQVEPDGGKTLAAAPQPAPVAPKKQKRIPVPKEFLTALKTADTLLAKAIEEYEDCQRRITYLSGSIPRLQRTVLALRNESNPDAPIPLPNAFNYNAPVPQFQPYVDPLEALNAAQPTPPMSRASGGAVQFSPEMVGVLEGPDDDDPDRFIQGPNAGGGWIGG